MISRQLKEKFASLLDVKMLQITVCTCNVMFNDGRKAEALDEFGVWEPGIFLKQDALGAYTCASSWIKCVSF